MQMSPEIWKKKENEKLLEWRQAVVQLLDLIRVMNGQRSLPAVAKGGEIKEVEDIRARREEEGSTGEETLWEEEVT